MPKSLHCFSQGPGPIRQFGEEGFVRGPEPIQQVDEEREVSGPGLIQQFSEENDQSRRRKKKQEAEEVGCKDDDEGRREGLHTSHKMGWVTERSPGAAYVMSL